MAEDQAQQLPTATAKTTNNNMHFTPAKCSHLLKILPSNIAVHDTPYVTRKGDTRNGKPRQEAETLTVKKWAEPLMLNSRIKAQQLDQQHQQQKHRSRAPRPIQNPAVQALAHHLGEVLRHVLHALAADRTTVPKLPRFRPPYVLLREKRTRGIRRACRRCFGQPSPSRDVRRVNKTPIAPCAWTPPR